MSRKKSPVRSFFYPSLSPLLTYQLPVFWKENPPVFLKNGFSANEFGSERFSSAPFRPEFSLLHVSTQPLVSQVFTRDKKPKSGNQIQFRGGCKILPPNFAQSDKTQIARRNGLAEIHNLALSVLAKVPSATSVQFCASELTAI
jgi:hypothetical protein